ncbi:MAG: hypothetical protein ACRD2O_12890 [Terriglobia bacterium]
MRTVEEFHERVSTVHLNLVKPGLVSKADHWTGAGVHDYAGSIPTPAGADRSLAADRVLLPAEGTTQI